MCILKNKFRQSPTHSFSVAQRGCGKPLSLVITEYSCGIEIQTEIVDEKVYGMDKIHNMNQCAAFLLLPTSCKLSFSTFNTNNNDIYSPI